MICISLSLLLSLRSVCLLVKARSAGAAFFWQTFSSCGLDRLIYQSEYPPPCIVGFLKRQGLLCGRLNYAAAIIMRQLDQGDDRDRLERAGLLLDPAGSFLQRGGNRIN